MMHLFPRFTDEKAQQSESKWSAQGQTGNVQQSQEPICRFLTPKVAPIFKSSSDFSHCWQYDIYDLII